MQSFKKISLSLLIGLALVFSFQAYATTGVKNWSTTAGDNDAAPPNGAPEGMAPSAVNNVQRQIMAEVRAWYEDAAWIDYGFSGLTYVDTTNFRVTGDQTATFVANRRIRAIGSTPFTVYGKISSSAYSAPNTTVTVTWDSSAMDNTLSEIALGFALTGDPIASNGINFQAATIPYATITDPPDVSNQVPTGVVSAYAGTTAPSGWVMVSNRTIGDATSGGTERANADTEDLFTLLWNSYDNTRLPIQDSSGVASVRGLSAAADFAAHKRLPLLDLRGRVIAGLDNMGGTSADRLTTAGGGVDGDVQGATGGAETHTLTIAQMPAHNHELYGDDPGANSGLAISPLNNRGGDTVDLTSTGGGEAHPILQPTQILPYIIKL